MNFENEYDLEKLVNNSLDLLTIVDLSGNVLLVNPAFERTLGWKKEDLVGKDPFHLLHPEDKESTYKEFEKLNQGLLTLSFQNRYICADGQYRYFSWTASPDLVSGLVYVTGRDITDVIESNRKISQLTVKLKETNDRLFEQASTDPLTKLKNRRMFNEELNNLIHACDKESHPLSLLMIDADHFKDYNDKFGHIAGDKVLVELASILTKTFRKKDVLARYGGEEFIAALPNTSEPEANQIAERLVQTVREFSWEKRSVTISVGITTYNFNPTSKSINSEYLLNLIEQADKALYCSKVSGRDRITHFSWVQNKKSGSI